MYLGVKLLSHMVTLCSSFSGTDKLFSKVTFQSAVCEESAFSSFSLAIFILCPFYYRNQQWVQSGILWF